MISAIGRENRVIGKTNGKIPWHISEDFKYFKKITMGHPIIMGSKTWESFSNHPLPGRIHIILARKSENYKLPENLKESKNILLVNSMENAVEVAEELDQEEIFIIGGGQIYNLGLPFVDKLYLTLVERKDHVKINGEVFFPEYQNIFTKKISGYKSSEGEYEFEFVILEK